jgi:hypothetical protein
VAVALGAAACGWTPADEQAVIAFFERSRIYDTTMLASVATVVFHPKTDGGVERFEVVDRGADQPLGEGRVRREMTIAADVRSPAGAVSRRTLAVTLEARGSGSWMVTQFR